MKKTKQEIIQETAEFYNSKTRAVNRLENCVYFDPKTGNKCAVGRCLDLPDEIILTFKGSVNDFSGSIKNDYFGYLFLEDVLKDEYKGHPPKFWGDLQVFHDSDYWNEGGLTEVGKIKYESLLKEWS